MRKLAKVLAGLHPGLPARRGRRRRGSRPTSIRSRALSLEVTDTMIAVQKGNDRWEIARDAGTKVHRRPEEGRQGHDQVPDDRHDRRGEARGGEEDQVAAGRGRSEGRAWRGPSPSQRGRGTRRSP